MGQKKCSKTQQAGTFSTLVSTLIHDLSHSFGHMAANLLKGMFSWHSIFKDAKEWPRSCIAYQRSDNHRHTDSCSSCTTALFTGWIVRFELQEHITSNRGISFAGRLWQSLAELLGTTSHHNTPYNPAANSTVERPHCSLKASLVARCINDSWFAKPPWILLE
ncbi:uncharacterized protein LOC143033163 [Oratosquilla oratoria]|uniref:uncharacterized protein LOC143033163 n=1 Tax=Oratosquilla oratoria TaxID=337810 RepID=UPI003F7572E4